MVNLNELAKIVTLKEGQKVNISIAQVKEVQALTFKELTKMTLGEISGIIEYYRKQINE